MLALRDSTRTNLQPTDMLALLPMLKSTTLTDSQHITIEDTDLVRKMPVGRGAYIVLPADASYAALRGFLSETLSG
jgi:hypothetical protein